MPELTQRELTQHYARLTALQQQAELAKTVEGRAELDRAWARAADAEQQRQDAERERAEQVDAERQERLRKVHEADAARQEAWAQTRDRLAGELQAARGILGLVNGGASEQLTVEQAETLRDAVYRLAAERLVSDAEAAAQTHRSQNGGR
jgi:hypothetical protein